MTVLPNTHASPPASRMAALSPFRLMFVGPEGAAAREIVERQLQAMLGASQSAAALPDSGPLPTPFVVVAADTILEAVLLSGDQGDEAREAAAEHLILAGVSQELEHLESAVRQPSPHEPPHSQIMLLCEPADEVISRKAKTWGADDYYLIPLDAASAQHLLTRNADPDAPGTPSTTQKSQPADPLEPRLRRQGADAPPSHYQPHDSPAQIPPNRQDGQDPELPALPLIVQTELLDDLLAGHPRFPLRRRRGMLGATSDSTAGCTFRPRPNHPPTRIPPSAAVSSVPSRSPISPASARCCWIPMPSPPPPPPSSPRPPIGSPACWHSHAVTSNSVRWRSPTNSPALTIAATS